MDTLQTFFLACFGFGALFTVGSLVLGLAGHVGAGHVGTHIHAGGHPQVHAGGHAGHVAVHAGHVAAHAGHSAGQAGHSAGQAGHGSHAGAHVGSDDQAGLLNAIHPSSLPLLNPSSALGFLTWFGAAGYLLVRYADWAIWAVVLGSLLAGALSWYLIARFLGLILAGEREMDPADYRLEGTVGRISVSVPAGGTGEVIFSKAGARRSEAARGFEGRAIARGTEVVITAYQDGFAIVQPWDEFVERRQSA